MARPSPEILATLEARERTVRDKIAERREALEDAARPADPVGDDADKAFERTRAEVEHDLIEHSLRELAEIAAVRERLSNGTYGECIECGEEILPARLEVNPTAQRCATCQSRHEKKLAAGLTR